MIEFALLLVFPALIIFGGVCDLLSMTIPNRVSILLFALFLVVAFIAGLSFTQIGMHLLVGFCVLTVGIALFAFGLCGAGDIKLLAAGSLWIGFEQLLPYFLYVSVAGAILSLLFVVFRSQRLLPLVTSLRSEWLFKLQQTIKGIPYGLAIAAGGLASFPSTVVYSALIS